MKHISRKERFESALSRKRQNVAVRATNSSLQLLIEACRCCLHGNWKAATTNFTTAMNTVFTGIVHPKAGANRKT